MGLSKHQLTEVEFAEAETSKSPQAKKVDDLPESALSGNIFETHLVSKKVVSQTPIHEVCVNEEMSNHHVSKRLLKC